MNTAISGFLVPFAHYNRSCDESIGTLKSRVLCTTSIHIMLKCSNTLIT